MPTVSLTPQQQATIDAANAQLSAAKSSLDSGIQELGNRETKAHASFASVMLCSGFKNKVKEFAILDAKTCAPCNINCKDCGGMGGSQTSECHKRVSAFNSDYNNWSVYKATVQSRQEAYDLAKKNLDNILDSISKDPTVQANQNIINNEIDAQKQKDMIKWLFFGLAAVLIVGGGIYIGNRVLGSRSAS